MSFLAGTFLLSCDEYDAFMGFTNFLHQHYFINLFKGYVIDVYFEPSDSIQIKLRIDSFNRNFKNLMPKLYQHFETLEIQTDSFLIDWMLTLFSKNMEIDLALRIWDNFLLDGEIYAIKTALAILMYFEKQFLKESHFKIAK